MNTSSLQIPKVVRDMIEKNQGCRLDIGGGDEPHEGFLNMDYRPLPQVDIVHDIEQFPWPIPDESVYVAMARHVLEHINPHEPDVRTTKLIELLLAKKLITQAEVAETIGDIAPGPIFMRFMDEVWRILKPAGQFMIVVPYAGSQGYWQDPTHVNGINQHTWHYFDPGDDPYRTELLFYDIYKPKPWKIEKSYWNQFGNMEVLMVKRDMASTIRKEKPHGQS